MGVPPRNTCVVGLQPLLQTVSQPGVEVVHDHVRDLVQSLILGLGERVASLEFSALHVDEAVIRILSDIYCESQGSHTPQFTESPVKIFGLGRLGFDCVVKALASWWYITVPIKPR